MPTYGNDILANVIFVTFRFITFATVRSPIQSQIKGVHICYPSWQIGAAYHHLLSLSLVIPTSDFPLHCLVVLDFFPTIMSIIERLTAIINIFQMSIRKRFLKKHMG